MFSMFTLILLDWITEESDFETFACSDVESIEPSSKGYNSILYQICGSARINKVNYLEEMTTRSMKRMVILFT